MKNIADVLNCVELKKINESDNVENLDDEKTKRFLNRLFDRFEGIFDKFWVNIKNQEHLIKIKQEWFEEFKNENISDGNIIAKAIVKAKKSDLEYLPKASQFTKWYRECQLEEFGLPDFETAYRISIQMNQQFSDYKPTCERTHQAIRHAINEIGTQNYRGMSDTQARVGFKYYYDAACRQLVSGELDKINKALCNDVDNSVTEEKRKSGLIMEQYKGIKAEEALAVMKNLLSGKSKNNA